MRFLIALILICISTSVSAQLEVMISGGFQGPYKQLLPTFEKSSGISVITKSGASQGDGPKTIKAQLAQGITADVVILSREGLDELITQGRIEPQSVVGLAIAPLGLAVPTGFPKPDISTIDSFKKSVIQAQRIVVPGSTSGIFVIKNILPKLGISPLVDVKVTERGAESTDMLAKKDANMAIQPTSELVNITGIDYVGILPTEIQLLQTYSAAIVRNSPNREAALRFIKYLSMPASAPAIRYGGLEPIIP